MGTMGTMGTMTMIFRCQGIDTEETFDVRAITDTQVTLDTDEELDDCKVFDLTSGKCLNDNTAMGCSRRLKLG